MPFYIEAFERDFLIQGSRWFWLPLWVAGQMTDHLVRFKTRPQLASKGYWRPVEARGFSERLTGKLFDITVNCGLGNMAKILQRAVNCLESGRLTVDGALGPKTKAAVSGMDEEKLLAAVVAEQKAHYERGVLKNFPNARQSFMDRATWTPED